MSYNISESFFEAQRAQDAYVVMAVITTSIGLHVFHGGICSATNLPSGTIYQRGARLSDISDLTETLLPDPSDFFANYTQTEQTDCTLTLSDEDNYFSLFLQHYSFLGAAIVLVVGYTTTPYTDMLTLFTGTVQRETLTNETLTILGVSE